MFFKFEKSYDLVACHQFLIGGRIEIAEKQMGDDFVCFFISQQQKCMKLIENISDPNILLQNCQF